jgi:signal peptidase I
MYILITFILFGLLILIEFGIFNVSARLLLSRWPKMSEAVSILIPIAILALVPLGGLLAIPLAIYLIHKRLGTRIGRSSAIYVTYAIPAVVLQVVIVLVVHNYVMQAFHVNGVSMSPTLNANDYILVSRTQQTWEGSKYMPNRSDIVVFRYPLDTTKIFIKRVVGVAGDHIVIKNGHAYISKSPTATQQILVEPYEPSATSTGIDVDMVVTPGNAFVIGDNRTAGGSYDSREWGLLPTKDIIGTVKQRLLPLDENKAF